MLDHACRAEEPCDLSSHRANGPRAAGNEHGVTFLHLNASGQRGIGRPAMAEISRWSGSRQSMSLPSCSWITAYSRQPNGCMQGYLQEGCSPIRSGPLPDRAVRQSVSGVERNGMPSAFCILLRHQPCRDGYTEPTVADYGFIRSGRRNGRFHDGEIFGVNFSLHMADKFNFAVV